MRAAGSGRRVLTIPPGVPFLRSVAEALLDGRLVPGYRHDPADPLSLARVTILVPTRRSARRLRAEFAELLGGQAAILPIIRTLGETDDDADYLDASAPDLLDLAPPIDPVVRLLELARLILAWRNKLPEIVRSIHSDSPLVAPASPADAVWLARALVELIDAVETEEIDWQQLERIDARDHASWWQLTLEFLRIASAFWPARLEELQRSSPVRHRTVALRGEIRRLEARGGGDPVIVAGSTGAIPSAVALIAAVSALPAGAVVLPGLDQDLSETEWQAVGPEPQPGRVPEPSVRAHPQYNMSRLLSRIGLEPREVVALGAPSPALADRAKVFSKAMAPAVATDDWPDWRQAFGAMRLEEAFADVSLIEAANEREEAAAIAIAVRLALETPGSDGESRAALITPDRALARRVAIELARYGIEADDSAGTPFHATAQGTLLKLALEAVLRPGDPVAIMALLKHPLCRFGLDFAVCRAAIDALEILALRGGVRLADISALGALLTARLTEEGDRRRMPAWRAALDDTAVAAAHDIAARIAEAVEPLASVFAADRMDGGHGQGHGASLALSDWATRAGRVLEAIARDPQAGLGLLWDREGGEALAGLLGAIIEADETIVADGAQFADIVEALSVGVAVKPRPQRNPRVFVFGTLEARLQRIDTVVIGGLNEGVWPGQAANNPFLSRHMKGQLGLEPPERRIGQLAHDLAMAAGSPRLVLSRALKQGGAPTVASRWLQRLGALGGRLFVETLTERGERYRRLAEAIDAGADQQPARRPDPRPPLDLQPKSYSFSEVGRLRRDPYAIYARRVLRLDRVLPFNAEPGPAERGTLYHAIVERFVRAGIDPMASDAELRLSAIADALFDAEDLPPHIAVVWRLRFQDVGRSFLAWERLRRPDIKRADTEIWGAMELPELGIRLTGIADRIDIKPAGFADILDYKTGSSPSLAQARSLLDPQLALEAAALAGGAFSTLGVLKPADLIYVRLRPGARFDTDTVNNELSERAKNPRSAVQLAEESLAQLTKLVRLLQNGERGFVSRLIPEALADHGGDYDHLARVAEWSTSDASEEGGDE